MGGGRLAITKDLCRNQRSRRAQWSGVPTIRQRTGSVVDLRSARWAVGRNYEMV